MKEYLDRKALLDYLNARAEMAEYVVNDDLLDDDVRMRNQALVLDRKDLVAIVEGMKPENPLARIIGELEMRIAQNKNWWPYEISLFTKGMVAAYESFLNFVKGLDEEGENDGD